MRNFISNHAPLQFISLGQLDGKAWFEIWSWGDDRGEAEWNTFHGKQRKNCLRSCCKVGREAVSLFLTMKGPHSPNNSDGGLESL